MKIASVQIVFASVESMIALWSSALGLIALISFKKREKEMC